MTFSTLAMPNYCPHCGAKYPDDGDVCVKCGRKADKKTWSSFKWYMHKRGKDNYAESFADYILDKLSYAMNIVITLGVVVSDCDIHKQRI